MVIFHVVSVVLPVTGTGHVWCMLSPPFYRPWSDGDNRFGCVCLSMETLRPDGSLPVCGLCVSVIRMLITWIHSTLTTHLCPTTNIFPITTYIGWNRFRLRPRIVLGCNFGCLCPIFLGKRYHLRTFILPPNLTRYCLGWPNPGVMQIMSQMRSIGF